jgi:hypothetical protein
MGGGGRGGGIEWVGDGQGIVAAYLARRRARLLALESSEALLASRTCFRLSFCVSPRPLS